MPAFKTFKNRQAVGNNTANVPLQKLQTARRTGECTSCTLSAARRLRPASFTESRVLNNRESGATTVSLMRARCSRLPQVSLNLFVVFFRAVCKYGAQLLRWPRAAAGKFSFARSSCQRSKWSFPRGIRWAISFRAVETKPGSASCWIRQPASVDV